MATIDHLGIAVKSIAAARGFYEALGMGVVHEETIEDEQVRTAMIPVGESRIELLEPTADDSPVGRFLAKRGEGLHHICVTVPDIRATLATLAARGLPLIDREPRVGAGGALIAFVHPKGSRGVLLELKQAGTGTAHCACP